jgi:hypothetical protein
MPSTSRREHRAMEGALHDEKIRQKLGIPREVAQEFVNADKRSDQWKERERAQKANDMAMSPKIYKALYG